MTIELISPRIVTEIERTYAELHARDSCLVPYIMQNIHTNAIRNEANAHSVKMEAMNSEAMQLDRSYRMRNVKKGKRTLEQAFNWGHAHFKTGEVTGDFIKDLAFQLEPFLYEMERAKRRDNLREGSFILVSPCYRSGPVRAGDAPWTPPQPAKIEDEMKKFLNDLNSRAIGENLGESLEAAIYAHFSLVRIHPFYDGNGRLARTVQNIILRKAKLPPPVIYSGERETYCEEMNNAVLGWRRRTSMPDKPEYAREECSFYNYIAGKILASMERIVEG